MKFRNIHTGEIREFDCTGINSSLVSAQNRQRLYWVGRRNEDGTYCKVNVEQPEDRGILLRDVLDSAVAWQDKSYCITTRCSGAIPEDTLTKHRHTMVGEPVCVAQRGRYSDTGKRCVKGEGVIEQFYEARADGKTNAITTVQKDNAVCEPIRIGCMPSPDGTIKNSQGMRLDSVDGKAINQTANGGGMGAKTGLYAMPYEYVDYTPRKNSHIVINENAIRCAQDKNNASAAESFVNFSDVKIGTITTAHIPKCIESADKHPKAQPIYQVKDGQITIKGKQYPIKLADGYYIISKLTVTECMRLQTVPEDYFTPKIFRIKEIYLCQKNVLSQVVRIPLQIKQQGCAINISLDWNEAELQNCDVIRLKQRKNVLLMDVAETDKHIWDTVLCIIKDTDETERQDLLKTMKNTLKAMMNTALSIDELLKKCSEENSNQTKSSIILTLTKKIMTHLIYMCVVTRNTFGYIDSCEENYSDTQQTSLTLVISYSTEKSMKLVSDSACYKMLGNGWTCDVITHLIKSALNQKTSQA